MGREWGVSKGREEMGGDGKGMVGSGQKKLGKKSGGKEGRVRDEMRREERREEMGE